MGLTTAAAVGLASAGVTAGMSFSQAAKQRKLMENAEREADIAMQAARKKLEVNVFDKLSLNKDVYEQQRDRFSADAAAAIQAGVESERGAPATAGRVLLASNQVQEGITSAMNQDLQQLEMISAQEDARLRDVNVQLDLEEVAGAQLAAANAQELRAQAMQQGFEGVQSISTQFATGANEELYGDKNPFNRVIGSGREARAAAQQANMVAQQSAQQNLLKSAATAARKPLFRDVSSLRRGN